MKKLSVERIKQIHPMRLFRPLMMYRDGSMDDQALLDWILG